MLTDEELDIKVKEIMFDLMLVLYSHGITEVNVGALMRILGVPAKVAKEHDAELIKLTKEFAKYVRDVRETKRPNNETLH